MREPSPTDCSQELEHHYSVTDISSWSMVDISREFGKASFSNLLPLSASRVEKFTIGVLRLKGKLINKCGLNFPSRWRLSGCSRIKYTRKLTHLRPQQSLHARSLHGPKPSQLVRSRNVLLIFDSDGWSTVNLSQGCDSCSTVNLRKAWTTS